MTPKCGRSRQGGAVNMLVGVNRNSLTLHAPPVSGVTLESLEKNVALQVLNPSLNRLTWLHTDTLRSYKNTQLFYRLVAASKSMILLCKTTFCSCFLCVVFICAAPWHPGFYFFWLKMVLVLGSILTWICIFKCANKNIIYSVSTQINNMWNVANGNFGKSVGEHGVKGLK